MKEIHLTIYGRVQGVFYRLNTKNKAKSLGLTGYTKNLENGRVEVVAEGPQEKLKELIEWCKKGPKIAKVDNLKIVWKDAKNKYDEFRIEQ